MKQGKKIQVNAVREAGRCEGEYVKKEEINKDRKINVKSQRA